MKFVRQVFTVLGGAALVATGGLAMAPQVADAADDVWDRVAACESSNRWDINTGNGYYGGLQFSPTTWQEFGGGQYAKRADLATKAEQIAIARRVLSVQGPNAWPVCSVRAGLTKTNGGADRNAVPDGEKKPTPDKPKGGITVSVAAGDTLSGLAARHKVPGGWKAIATANGIKNPNLLQIGQKLFLPGVSGGSSSNPNPPKSDPTPSKPNKPNKPSKPSTGKSKTVTVVSGDTLSGLAARHRVPGGWGAIADANQLSNPNLIRVGQKLVLPQ